MASKDGIQPLSGLVETDWAPLHLHDELAASSHERRPVAFERGRADLHDLSGARGLIEKVEPEFRSMDGEPERGRGLSANGSKSRVKFNTELRSRVRHAHEEKWQKDYFSGRMPDGSPTGSAHRTKVKAKPFK